MNRIEIYNIQQANFLMKRKAVSVGCGFNNENKKFYISFLRDDNFKIAMDSWSPRTK